MSYKDRVLLQNVSIHIQRDSVHIFLFLRVRFSYKNEVMAYPGIKDNYLACVNKKITYFCILNHFNH